MRRRATKSTVLTTLGLGVAIVLVVAGCTAGGPITYTEAEELRGEIADIEDRLGDVESMLSDVQNGDLPDEASQTVGDAADGVSTVLASLEDVREALEPPEPASEMPQQPAPGGAGGTSM